MRARLEVHKQRRARRAVGLAGATLVEGDELVFECRIEAARGPIGKGKATAHVGDQLVARGTLTFAVER